MDGLSIYMDPKNLNLVFVHFFGYTTRKHSLGLQFPGGGVYFSIPYMSKAKIKKIPVLLFRLKTIKLFFVTLKLAFGQISRSQNQLV